MAQQGISEFQQSAEQTLRANIQDRLIAPCATFDERGLISADIPALLNRLLLFENYYLQTIRLREFGSLVRILGLDNVILLLDSGTLKLDLNPTQFGQTGQTDPRLGIREKPPLPLFSYSFSLLLTPQRNDYLVRSIEELHRDLGTVISWKDLTKLDGAILRAIAPLPENTGVSAMLAFDSDLKANSPIFKKALLSRLRLKRDFGSIKDSDISLAVRPIGETDFVTDSNLESLGLTKEEGHKIVESALLAAGALNRRIEDMQNYHALSGAIDDELPLFGEKFDFIAADFSPKVREHAFDRVLRIGHFPSFDFPPLTTHFDMQKFLDIRDSEECSDFRDWLRHSQFLDDREIHSQVASLRAHLGNFVCGTRGKLVRFAVTSGLGLIPVAGLAVSALDTFVLEKILPISGPAMFLDSMYGSLFEQRARVDE